MPRKIRFCKLHARYHIMLRGVAGQNIFVDEKDKIKLCLLLQAAKEKYKFLIHAFCFMKNHLHFILEPTQAPLNECVHAFSFRYAQYFNKRHKRQGYLFQGRFRSVLVDDGMYLKRLIRYIHLNPLEACVVRCPEEYRWSSHLSYLGINDYVWLTKDLILSRFAPTLDEAIPLFERFMQPQADMEIDKKHFIKAFRVGVYGSDNFINEFSTSLPLAIKKACVEMPKKISLNEALSHICNKYQVTLNDLTGHSKKKHIVDARSILALLARIGKQDWNLQHVASLLNKNHGTISRLASRIKEESSLMSFAQSMLL